MVVVVVGGGGAKPIFLENASVSFNYRLLISNLTLSRYVYVLSVCSCAVLCNILVIKPKNIYTIIYRYIIIIH